MSRASAMKATHGFGVVLLAALVGVAGCDDGGETGLGATGPGSGFPFAPPVVSKSISPSTLSVGDSVLVVVSATDEQGIAQIEVVFTPTDTVVKNVSAPLQIVDSTYHVYTAPGSYGVSVEVTNINLRPTTTPPVTVTVVPPI